MQRDRLAATLETTPPIVDDAAEDDEAITEVICDLMVRKRQKSIYIGKVVARTSERGIFCDVSENIFVSK